MLEVHR